MSLVYQQTYDALVQPNSPSKGWVQTLVDEVVALFYVYVSPPQVDKIKGLSARTISWLSGDLLKKVDPNDLGAKVRGADPHLASFWGAKQFKLDWISHLGYRALMHLYESQKNAFTDAQIQAMGTKQKIALLAYALEQKGRPDPARQQLGERLEKQVRNHFPNLTEEEAKCLWNLLSKHHPHPQAVQQLLFPHLPAGFSDTLDKPADVLAYLAYLAQTDYIPLLPKYTQTCFEHYLSRDDVDAEQVLFRVAMKSETPGLLLSLKNNPRYNTFRTNVLKDPDQIRQASYTFLTADPEWKMQINDVHPNVALQAIADDHTLMDKWNCTDKAAAAEALLPSLVFEPQLLWPLVKILPDEKLKPALTTHFSMMLRNFGDWDTDQREKLLRIATQEQKWEIFHTLFAHHRLSPNLFEATGKKEGILALLYDPQAPKANTIWHRVGLTVLDPEWNKQVVADYDNIPNKQNFLFILPKITTRDELNRLTQHFSEENCKKMLGRLAR